MQGLSNPHTVSHAICRNWSTTSSSDSPENKMVGQVYVLTLSRFFWGTRANTRSNLILLSTERWTALKRKYSGSRSQIAKASRGDNCNGWENSDV